jgi:NAD(P) transhydrogenase subunit alpha
MNVGIPRETAAGERRVAMVPELVPKLINAGFAVSLESGAGSEAGFPDQQYVANGARLDSEILAGSDIILKVRPPNPAEIAKLNSKAILIGLLEPFSNGPHVLLMALRNVTAFSMELIPRIARTQSMDALSAMSTIAGYKAVLLAANRLPKLFPLMMTAAGTIPPARVFVIGAGVGGLEAIGTAKRLGAVVEAYDTRSAVKEEIESVGGKFINLDLGEPGIPRVNDSSRQGAYAQSETEEFYKKQQQLMTCHVATADVIIAAALVRGRRAPVLITEDMVRSMRPGSVIVDLAADQGGNCALTSPDQEIVANGVTILGPLNLPSSMAYHASEMYSRTLLNFLLHISRNGTINIDVGDEIVRSTLLTHTGEIVWDARKRPA